MGAKLLDSHTAFFSLEGKTNTIERKYSSFFCAVKFQVNREERSDTSLPETTRSKHAPTLEILMPDGLRYAMTQLEDANLGAV